MLARAAWLPLLTLALVGIGCGQQDEDHSNTGPVTNPDSNVPTPATRPEPAPPAEAGAKSEPSPAPAAPADPTPEKTPASESGTAPNKSAAVNVEPKDVTFEKLTYDAFLKRVADNPSKARYTVVDAWATWCGPCKENFPHIVQMQQKYADKGVAVTSLSFDDPTETKHLEEAKTFLQEKKAFFPNYLLDEEFGVGFEKFGVNAIPAVFIYGPDGKELKRFTWDDPNHQFTYDEVEKAVVALLESH